MRLWIAPVQPLPVKRTLSASDALTAFLIMSLIHSVVVHIIHNEEDI